MPTIPVATRSLDITGYEPVSAFFTGEWIVTGTNQNNDGTPDEPGVWTGSRMSEILPAVIERGANASPLVPLSPPTAYQGVYSHVFATSSDTQGCAVSVRSTGAFRTRGVTSTTDLWFLPIDFTYPEEWDDGFITQYYVWPVVEIHAVYHEILSYKRAFVGEVSAPLFEVLNLLILSGSRNYSLQVTGGSAHQYGYADDSSLEVFARAATAYDRIGAWFTGLPSVPTFGTQWEVPSLPDIKEFVFNWGDGEPDTDVSEVTTVHSTDKNDTTFSVSVSHEYELPAVNPYVRAIDAYGRKTGKVFLKTDKPITGENRLSATHNAHGETFVAKAKTTPSGVQIVRTVTAMGVAANLSFVPDARKPGIYHNANNLLFLGYIAPSTQAFTLYSTLDCGETWEFMTETPFSNADYYPVVPFSGMVDGLHAVAAFKRKTTEVWFSLFNGNEWNEPIRVTTLSADSSKIIAGFQESVSGSSRLRIVGNTLDVSSLDYGASWGGTT